MRNSFLWYLKRGDKVTGPFPAKVISDYLLLGRIRQDDLLSTDRKNWEQAVDHRELFPPVLLESAVDAVTLREARLKVDERCQQRRAVGVRILAMQNWTMRSGSIKRPVYVDQQASAW